jgi:ubiquinone/menaquinone biosynthesis C-methylase UbiE
MMAWETAAVNEAALDLLELQPEDRVLEVGFGHGATIARADAALSRGFVAGVDPSAEMCRMAARRNRSAIAAGRVELRQAAVEALPYADAAFDKAFSVHTVYFWPDLRAAAAEIRRVLKASGRLVLAWRYDLEVTRVFPGSVYRFPDETSVVEALWVAGFDAVEVVLRRRGRAVLRLAVARARGDVMPTRY